MVPTGSYETGLDAVESGKAQHTPPSVRGDERIRNYGEKTIR